MVRAARAYRSDFRVLERRTVRYSQFRGQGDGDADLQLAAPGANFGGGHNAAVGSLAIILNRFAWLGAGSLSVFLVLTIPVAHAFWNMQEPQRTFEFFVVLEHVLLIVAACLGAGTGQTSVGVR